MEPVHEALANAGSRQGKMYAHLPYREKSVSEDQTRYAHILQKPEYVPQISGSFVVNVYPFRH